jgi:uncharacterized protein (DUF1330 family)
MLRRLERSRLIRRERNPRDGRGTLLFLTAKGERSRVASRPVFQRALSDMIEGFTARELRVVLRFLNTLVERGRLRCLATTGILGLRRARTAAPVYALGPLTILDRARYLNCVRRFSEVPLRFGGRLPASDAPEVLEGAWEGDKVVLLAFQSIDSFWPWAHSDEDQEISRNRPASTEGTVLRVHGRG